MKRALRQTMATLITLAVSGFAAVGCERSRGAAMQPASNPENPSRAVEAIAAARCDYAQRCGEVGPPGHRGATAASVRYAGPRDCMESTREDTQRVYGACTGALDNDDVRACVSAINTDSCSNWTEEMTQFEECSSSNVCAGR